MRTSAASLRGSIIGMLVFALLACATEPSYAGLAVSTAAPVELTDADMLLMERNPALRDLSSVSPELLRKALDLIAEARSGKNQGRGIGSLDQSDIQLMNQNPVLLEVWQSSPEASEDLLQLLKSAAGGGKSQK
jgi:hypothetical protein